MKNTNRMKANLRLARIIALLVIGFTMTGCHTAESIFDYLDTFPPSFDGTWERDKNSGNTLTFNSKAKTITSGHPELGTKWDVMNVFGNEYTIKNRSNGRTFRITFIMIFGKIEISSDEDGSGSWNGTWEKLYGLQTNYEGYNKRDGN